MSPHEAEALDYPSAHRDRALDLLLRREALTTALSGAPSTDNLVKQQRWANIICWAVVALAVLTMIATFAGIVGGKGPQMFTLSLVAVSLVALITITKNNQNRDRRDRLTLALEMTQLHLDRLRDDYTNTEEASYSDLTTLDRLKPGIQEASNRTVLIFATIGLIIVAVTFLALATGMFLS